MTSFHIRMLPKAASVASYLLGIGFGIPAVYGIWSLWTGKGIARVLGFPTYGEGPFEKIGVHTTVPLMVVFLLVCTAQCVIGQLLWNADKSGAILSLAIIPLELAFYIGFALPFGPPFMAIRTVLVFLAWSSFR